MSMAGLLYLVVFALLMFILLPLWKIHKDRRNDAISLKFAITYSWKHMSGGKIIPGDCLKVTWREGDVEYSSDFYPNPKFAHCSRSTFSLLRDEFKLSQDYVLSELDKNTFVVHLKWLNAQWHIPTAMQTRRNSGFAFFILLYLHPLIILIAKLAMLPF